MTGGTRVTEIERERERESETATAIITFMTVKPVDLDSALCERDSLQGRPTFSGNGGYIRRLKIFVFSLHYLW